MSRRWMGMLLAAVLLAMAAPALAAEEASPAPEETAPVEGAVVEEETPIAEEAAPAAGQGVTLTIEGPTDGIDWYVWYGLDDIRYGTSEDGTWYSYLETPSAFPTQVWVEETDQMRRQVTVAPGSLMWVFIDSIYDITVTGGTITENNLNTFDLGREVYVRCPDSGSATLHIAPADGYVPERIPFTFYNETTDRIVGGGSTDDYAYPEEGAVTTGGSFEVWTAPGYEIQVLEGGSITKTCAPSGPAAQSVPAGSTCYELHVDLGAKRFAIAAVKKGETFQEPAETPPETDDDDQEDSLFTDVAAGEWYAEPIRKAYEKGIVKGVTDTTFDPNGTTTRGQTVTMLYRAMGSPSAAAVFSDTSGETAYAAGWASAAGVTKGVSDTKFAPGSAVTREQLVTMLYRLAGSPAVNTAILITYTDGAAVQSYAKDAAAWAVTNGLLTGYGDGSLKPGATATRAEVCALIIRYLGK